MRSYSVLDREESIRQHTLLEASAGTGKTFSIENLVVRLLCEEPALTIDQILVVTFTRASTRELKERIRSQLYRALDQLGSGDEAMPDYLFALVEAGQEVETYRRLSEALFAYDEAQIFTIHGFCFRMLQEQQLEGGVVASSSDTLSLPPSEVIRVIHDFFRTELTEELISPAQLRRLLKAHGGDAERLAEALRRIVTQPELILPDTVSAEFLASFFSLREKFDIDPESLTADFIAMAPCFKKTTNRQGEISPDLMRAVEKEVSLLADPEWTSAHFDGLIETGLQLVAALDPAMKKARAKEPDELRSLVTFERLRAELLPLVERARDSALLFATVAHHCQKMVQRVFEEKEWLSPDLLLRKMGESVREPGFSERIRGRYAAAIVDEFQDTDPLQWSIFAGLFLDEKWSGHLYLVGDPKQSIYAFRQADIYTYLTAAERLGQDSRAVLSTNYRSTPELIHALNLFFDRPDLFPLPKLGSSLGYIPVSAPEGGSMELIGDERGALHFMVAEGPKGRSSRWPTESMEELYFTFMGNEVLRLHRDSDLAFSSIAMLVRDRYQASRLSEFLSEMGIPSLLRRDRLLTDSPAYQAVLELCEALLDPYRLSSLRVVLGGLFYAVTAEELREDEQLVEWRCWFRRLSRCWREKGVVPLFEEFLFGERGIGLALLQRDANLYQDLHQWGELLSDLSMREQLTPERLLERVRALGGVDASEDPLLRIQRDMQVDAVQLLTMHVSKGLEFDVVFALGLVNRTSRKDPFARTEKGLLVASQDEEATERYRREIDAEKMRQLYVAMTRAKRRLYVPLLLQSDAKEAPPLGEASPMELYWQEGNGLEAAREWLDERARVASISYSVLADDEREQANLVSPMVQELVPPPTVAINEKRLFVHSYSSLADSRDGTTVVLPEGEPTLHSLPAGARTGVTLHTILESVDFASENSIKETCERVLKGGELQAWIPAVTHGFLTLASTPMPFGKPLSQVNRIIREMPFLYGENPGDHLFTGFIDCVVEVNDRLYVIDWKSNWLGPDGSYYTQERIEEVMRDHDYYLQASIYTAALQRHCEKAEKRDFSERFGGVLYYFLRGALDGEGGYFFQPTPYVHGKERLR